MNPKPDANLIEDFFSNLPASYDPVAVWPQLLVDLRASALSARSYIEAWERLFSIWDSRQGLRPIWIPTERDLGDSNLGRWMRELGFKRFAEFHHWTVTQRAEFWRQAVDRLNIRFRIPAQATFDSADVRFPNWFAGAKLNIVESCFHQNDEAIAIVYQRPEQALQTMTYGELRRLTHRVSNSLRKLGCHPGDAIAVVLPMTALSVPIYLGIVAAGCQVVSIADSFAAPEIATRLKIAAAKWVVTYDVQVRGGKRLELFSRVAAAGATPAIVIRLEDSTNSGNQQESIKLRQQDLDWDAFLVDKDSFEPYIGQPHDTINILFSSGTTGDPKAIPWNHLTPVKCAVDGYCHQNIQPDWVCAWPTNLGWMMGPWLIFATLINRGTLGLYEDAPMGPGFGQFIQAAQVKLLGVVPTLVKAWRSNGEMEACDWSSIEVFSSTGESSQASDMVYLSALAGIKPIIEYCGGTEIGGGYITSTVCEPNYPAVFNTPAVGIDFVLLNDQEQPTDEGELFLIPPSIGLSERLLNRDHDATYFEGTPRLVDGIQLRRHGDHFRRVGGKLNQNLYQAGGRVDDTMNLGGIKISSAEIERVLNQLPGIVETAAVAFSGEGGPDELIVFVVGNEELNQTDLLSLFNWQLKQQLNPLFRVSDVRVVSHLPRTASGKVMRRELRKS